MVPYFREQDKYSLITKIYNIQPYREMILRYWGKVDIVVMEWNVNKLFFLSQSKIIG